MMNKEAGNVDGDGSSNSGQLLREIEAISKALYLHTPGSLISQSKVRSRSVDKPCISGAWLSPNPRGLDGCVSYKDKKGSMWNWKKPWRALAHIGDQKFNVCFFLHVHSIEGLPPSFNDMSLSVHWKRKDESLQTRPSKVVKGIAEFDETLVNRCSVYGNRSGPHNSMKYDSKIFLIYASVVGVPFIYLGKQWIDLTRLLPLTWEELVGEKGTGRWTTNFKLMGKAKGATLSVSLGFSVIGDNAVDGRSDMKVSELLNLAHNGSCMTQPTADIGWSQSNTMLQQIGKVSETSVTVPPPSFQPVDVKIFDDVSPRLGLELSKSMNFLYQKLNEVNFNATKDLGRDVQPLASKHGQDFKSEKRVRGKGDDNLVDLITKHKVDMTEKKEHELEVDDVEVTSNCTIEMINVDEIFEDDDDNDEVNTNTYFLSEDNTLDGSVDEIPMDDGKHEEDKLPQKGSSMEDPELIFHGLLLQQLGCSELSLSEDELSVQLSYREWKAAYKADSVREILMDDDKHEENKLPEKGSSMDDLEMIFRGLHKQSGSPELPLHEDELSVQESYMKQKVAYKAGLLLKKSHSLDEVAESVANEFLNMLGIDHSPSGQSSNGDLESPRGCLLWEFEEEALASQGFFMEYDTMREHDEYGNKSPSEFGFGDVTYDFDLSLAIQSVEENHRSSSQLYNRRKGKLVEDLETETLMKEWGLSERAFQNSPRICSDGFGSPIELPPEEPVALPPLGEGFGPLVRTKGGGCLGSMDPSLFKNSKNVGALIMQVSRIVVLPSELGCDNIEILQHLASAGMENLSLRFNELLPLEDVTGKSLEEIVMDGNAGPATSDGQVPFCHFPSFEQNASGWREGWVNSDWSSSDIKCGLMHQDLGLDYITLEDPYTLIMDKIAALSIEGLRIQSGMSDGAAPSSICPQPIEKMLNFDGKCANLGGFLDIEKEVELSSNSDSSGDIDELFGFSITLEEWLQLDAGIIGDNDQISNRITKILKAHHAKCMDFPNGRLRREVNLKNDSGRRHGMLGNNLTVALKVLLRDPLRDYDPVGSSMLALVQLERRFSPLRLKPYRSFSEGNSSEEGDDIQSEDIGIIKEEKEEWCPYFKYVEAHLSGLSTDSGKMNLWGTKTQQQSAARWLLASGMSKSYKQPLSKSKAIVVSNPLLTRKMQNSDFLWSITSHTSSCGHSSGSVLHTRNPNVVFLN